MASLVAVPSVASAAGPAPHYLMTAFTNSSESNMYVYDSANATNFTQVRANAYTPPSGLIRDPSVIRHTDGYYYIVYTTNWTGDTIGFARSADYVSWTFLRNVRVGLNGATGSTWAPEWFKDSDGSVHVIFSASTAGTAGQFRPYRITATNSDLSAWTSPVALGIPANFIDSFVVKVGGTYHNFLKNETTKYIEHATATSLNGPWTFVGTGNWAGWGAGLEGPAVVRLPDGRWRIYFDQYGQRRYFYADSANLNSFGGKVEMPGLSGVARHFTVLREDSGDNTAVPTGNRSLRSISDSGPLRPAPRQPGLRRAGELVQQPHDSPGRDFHHRAGTGEQQLLLVPVGELPGPLSAALRLPRPAGHELLVIRCSPATPRSAAAPAWPVARRSSRTPIPAGTCATTTSRCASTGAPPTRRSPVTRRSPSPRR